MSLLNEDEDDGEVAIGTHPDESEHVEAADSDPRFERLRQAVVSICNALRWNKEKIEEVEGTFMYFPSDNPRKHLVELLVNEFGREHGRALARFRDPLVDGDDEVIRRKIKKALNLHRWELQRAEWEEEERRNPRSKAWKFEERKERERQDDVVRPRRPYRGGDRTKHAQRKAK